MPSETKTEINVVDQAATFAAEKALQLATGYIGAKAGQWAGRALNHYAHRFRRRPWRVLAYSAAGAAAAWVAWRALSRRRT